MPGALAAAWPSPRLVALAMAAIRAAALRAARRRRLLRRRRRRDQGRVAGLARATALGACCRSGRAVAALGTFAGFLPSSRPCGDGSAISAISLMNALAALVGAGLRPDRLRRVAGTTRPARSIAHLAAIAVVLGCVPVLAAAQAAMAAADPSAGEPGTAYRRVRRRLRTPG